MGFAHVLGFLGIETNLHNNKATAPIHKFRCAVVSCVIVTPLFLAGCTSAEPVALHDARESYDVFEALPNPVDIFSLHFDLYGGVID